MSRLKRKNRPDIGYKGCGGIGDALDDMMKQMMRVSNEEYEFLLDKSNENPEFMDVMVSNLETISEKRKMLIFLEKYLIEYGEEITKNSKS